MKIGERFQIVNGCLVNGRHIGAVVQAVRGLMVAASIAHV